MTVTKSPAERQTISLATLQQAVEMLASLLDQSDFSLPSANPTFCQYLTRVKLAGSELFGGPPPRVPGQLEAIPTGANHQLLELRNEVNRLRQLLADPQPGLATWTKFLFVRAYNIEAIGTEMLGGKDATANLRRELKH